MSRYRRRAALVATSSLNGMLVPALGLLVSLAVVRLASAELWGAFVQVMIVAQFVAHVVAWGNREYLLREFSRSPARIPVAWQGSLATRAALLLPLAPILLLLGWPLPRALLTGAWIAGLVMAQSAEVLVAFQRAFGFAALVDVGATAVLVLATVVMAPLMELDGLILLFALASLARAGVLLVRFRRLALGGRPGDPSFLARLDVDHLRSALPFFLLGFTGMLQSRVDLYAVSFMVQPPDVARYQVFMNLMIYLQAGANFVVLPFAKNIYRMRHASILRFSGRLFLAGFPMILLALLGIHLVLDRLYGFDFPWQILLLGGLYVWPIYLYLPNIYTLYRANAQTQVVVINGTGAAVNLGLSLLLVPRVGIAGALLAATTVQWLVCAIYVSYSRILGHRHEPALP